VAGNDLQRLKVISKASDAISCGDVANNAVRGQGEWSLMPFQALVSTVYPATYMRGSREIFGLYPGEANMARFSAWLGNTSSTGKQTRVLSEVHSHVQCSQHCQADRSTLLMEYLSLFRRKLTGPLIKEGKEGIAEVLKLMDEYCFTRADWDQVFELTKFKSKAPWNQDQSKKIETKVKTAFTRQFNQASHTIMSGMGDNVVEPFSQKGKKKGKKVAKKAAAKKEVDEEDEAERELEEEKEQQKISKMSNKRLQAINFKPLKEEPKPKKAKGAKGKKK
jgi:replication factor C subunit 1